MGSGIASCPPTPARPAGGGGRRCAPYNGPCHGLSTVPLSQFLPHSLFRRCRLLRSSFESRRGFPRLRVEDWLASSNSSLSLQGAA